MNLNRGDRLAAANRRFRFPSVIVLWFEGSVLARRPLTAPVVERDGWANNT
jgi:hypothetical protein